MIDLSESLIQALPDLTLLVRSDGVIVGNLGGQQLGITERPGELKGSSLQEVWTEEIASTLHELVRRALRTRTAAECHYVHQARHYEARVQPLGIQRVLLVLRRVSDAAAHGTGGSVGGESELALEYRTGFEQRLAAAIDTCQLRELPLALVAIHLGGLADARDAIGPRECSRQLMQTLARLRAPVAEREGPQLSPFGRIRNDLFAVLLFGMPDANAVAHAAERIRVALAEPLAAGEIRFQLRPMLGIARFPEDGSDAHTLLANARAALLRARASDHDSTIAFCSRNTQRRSQSAWDTEQELRGALEQQQLSVRYQPVVDLATQRAAALRALIHWAHPVFGERRLEESRQAAGRTPLGAEIDEWACGRMCADIAGLGNPTLRVRIAVGRRTLEAGKLVATLERCARDASVDLGRVELGIGEQILSTAGSALSQLRELRERGVRVLAESFSGSRIPLERLAVLPLDGLVIDLQAVGPIEDGSAAPALCRSVVSIARAFGLRSCAVGVESARQAEFVAAIGCDTAQGSHFGAPCDIETFRLARRRVVNAR